MFYGYTPKFILKFSEFLDKRIIRIELFSISIVLIGYLIYQSKKELGELIVNFSLISLAFAYYFLAFKECADKFDKFMTRLMNFSYSTSVIGVLFTISHWPGGFMILRLALIGMTITITLLMILDKVLKKISINDNSKMLRSVIILGVLLLLTFFPIHKYISNFGNSKTELNSND